jgi:ATP:ADP antiporter, AAA family
VRRPLANLGRAERVAAIGGFLTLFGILAAHTLTETARDALFLARLPAEHLAGVYFAIAALSVVLTPIEQRLLRRFGGPLGLSVLLLGGAATLLLFHSMARTGRHYTFIALYIYSSLFATLATVHFWLLVGFKFTVTEAKRVFGFIGAGAVIGAVFGAGLARGMTQLFSARQLLLPAAGLLAISALGPPIALRTRRAERPIRRAHALAEDLPLLRSDPYLRRVALLILASAVVFTLTDYVFKSVVSHHVPAERLGKFFATTYTGLNVLALVAQLGVVELVVRKAGVTRALAVLPVLLFLGGAGLVFGGGLAAVLLVKGADGGLRHSLHRTGVELLYLPIAEKLRARLKSLIDGVGQRGGQAIGSVLILADVRFGHGGEAWLGAAITVIAGAWLLGVRGLRQHYFDMFRDTLARGAPLGRLELPALDLRSLSMLIASLNSPDDREVMATLDLLAAQERVELVPALILYHPSSAVVLAALALFTAAGRKDHLPVLARLVRHEDPEVRAAAIAARVAIDPGGDLLVEALHDPSPVVRATALVELVATGHHLATPELRRAADELPTWSEAALLSFVRGIRRHPTPALEPVLSTLARSPNPAVRVEVASAMGELGARAFVPELVAMLGDPATRPAARRALLSFGPRALDELDRALDDPATPIAVRRHLPRTISRFDPTLAAPILVSHITHARGMVRFKLLVGLGNVVRENPDIELDRDAVSGVVEETLAAAAELRAVRLELEAGVAAEPARATPTEVLVRLLLENKQALATERVFRLLGVLNPREDFERIYRGLSSPDPSARDSSRELTEHLVEPAYRARLLDLIEDRADARGSIGEPPAEKRPYVELLAEMLRYPSTSLRSLVAAHAGELGLVSLRGAIAAARPPERGPLAAVFERAVERIDALHRGEVSRAG